MSRKNMYSNAFHTRYRAYVYRGRHPDEMLAGFRRGTKLEQQADTFIRVARKYEVLTYMEATARLLARNASPV